MTGGSAVVMAEWATFGKTESDSEYRLLSASTGPTTSKNFTTLFWRYAAGELESFPQVTIRWLRHDEEQGQAAANAPQPTRKHFLVIAVHDEVKAEDEATAIRMGAPVPSRADSVGRPTPLARCYCMPFADLAAGPVCYSEMYRRLSEIRLPYEGGGLISAGLTGGLALPGTVMQAEAAAQAAALLLTGEPVCIVDNGVLSTTDRLYLLDTAASMLPYGLRSELSAATWVSSTAKNHRFRLYFSSAARPQDKVVNLAKLEDIRVPSQVTGRYLEWLLTGGDIRQRCDDLLTLRHIPMRFGERAANWLDEWTRRPPAHEHDGRQARWWVPRPALPAARPRQDPAQRLDPGRAIRDYADSLQRGDARRDIGPLRQVMAQGLTAEDQENCRHVIRESRLLRPSLADSKDALAEFYRVVIPRVFGPRLDYAALNDIGDCAGGVLHDPLITVVAGCEFDNTLTQVFAALLELRVSGGAAVDGGPAGLLTTRPLISLVAGAGLQLSHQHRDLVWDMLTSQPGLIDRDEARAVLVDRRFFAQDMVIWSKDNTEEQTTRLSRLLRLAYDPPLSQDDVEEIIASAGVVTDALAAAITMHRGSGLARKKGRWELVGSSQTGTTTTGIRLRLPRRGKANGSAPADKAKHATDGPEPGDPEDAQVAEMETREIEARQAEARLAEARETEARLAEARQVQARQTEAQLAEARRALALEADARLAEARQALAWEAKARQAQAREAEAQAREAEAREAEARAAEDARNGATEDALTTEAPVQRGYLAGLAGAPRSDMPDAGHWPQEPPANYPPGKHAAQSGAPPSELAGQYTRPLQLEPLQPRQDSKATKPPDVHDMALQASRLGEDQRIDASTMWQTFRTPVLVTSVILAVVVFLIVFWSI